MKLTKQELMGLQVTLIHDHQAKKNEADKSADYWHDRGEKKIESKYTAIYCGHLDCQQHAVDVLKSFGVDIKSYHDVMDLTIEDI